MTDPVGATSRPRRAVLALAAAATLLVPGCGRKATRDPGIPAVLRWAGDPTGGEPYILERQGRPPDGFEGELARYLAAKLGVKSEFVQGQWDVLPQRLARHDCDLILNGYEWSAEREKVMASTVPYYAYRLRLIVRRDSPIRGWADLADAELRVGVLKDSAAERYLREHYPRLQIEALTTLGVTGVMELVAKGGFDATVQDDPVVSWYMTRQQRFPTLHAVGEPLAPTGQSYYVGFVRKEDRQLRAAIDRAIRDGIEDGSLRRLYERYGVWSKEQEGLARAGEDWPPAGVEEEDAWGIIGRELLRGAGWTVALACTAMPLAMLVGLVVALGRLYGPGWVAAPLGVYVEVIRGTPVLLQLFVIYFFLPEVGVSLPAFWAGVFGLALNYSAYEAENYRAGLLAIPSGQMEAALSLGMSKGVALRRIVVPQALRLVVPPVTNDFIALFKDTSVCYAIGIAELMARNQTLMSRYSSLVLAIGLLTALLYLLMSYPLSLLARRLERRGGKVEVKG